MLSVEVTATLWIIFKLNIILYKKMDEAASVEKEVAGGGK